MNNFLQVAGSCPFGQFFARGVRLFGAPGVAGMLGFGIFGAQRQGVRGFWRTGRRGGARGPRFSLLDARGFEILGADFEKLEKICVFFCVVFCVFK